MKSSDDVILLTGLAGAGKDYNAKLYVKKGYVQVNFADALRDLTWKTLKWKPKDDEEYEWFKANPIAAVSYKNDRTVKGRILYYLIVIFKIGMLGRQFLQYLGTEGCRDVFGENIWITKWNNTVNNLTNQGKKIVCSDARFPNELLIGKKYNAKILFYDYRSPKYTGECNHPSELFGYALVNEGFKDGDEVSKVDILGLWRKYYPVLNK